jgi:ATP/maltotriose-dependent transcriptional regulator MalT
MTLGYLGRYALWKGDLERAARLGEECSVAAREGGGDWMAFADHLLAQVALARGDLSRAGELYRSSLKFDVLQDEGMMIAECLEGLAGVAGELGDAARGATLLGAAEMVRERYDTPVPPQRQGRHDQILATVCAGLRGDELAAAWDAGRQLALDEAVRYALEPEATAPHSSEVTNSAGLSRREVEVLRLLVDGLSDREIGERLYISHRTVMRHVTSILNKLGVNSRTAAATRAVREGIV